MLKVKACDKIVAIYVDWKAAQNHGRELSRQNANVRVYVEGKDCRSVYLNGNLI